MIESAFRMERGGFRLEVDETFPGRGVTALFGPSGCGKTTWLRVIAGLERIRDAVIRFDGRTWQNGSAFLPVHRRPIGYVFQDAALFPHMSVEANLRYGWRRAEERNAGIPWEEVIGLLELEPLLHRRPASLSGGEAQRVAIGRALLSSPRLLLMDEPLSALDAEARRHVLSLLERLKSELSIPVVYVSHSRDEVARLTDHLVLMERGRVRASGPLTELWTRLDIAAEHGGAASSVVEARVAGHDDAWNLTLLDFPGGRFMVARESLPTGTEVRLRIMARDVSITLERQTGTSILNIFPATVTGLAPTGPAQMLVRLDAGGVPLLSGITRRSAHALGLEPGRKVHAQVKAVALL